MSNGLGSPLCAGTLEAAKLPMSSRRNCETSGFVAAAAPTSGYGLDVHIDTGFMGLNSGGLLSAVQDLFIEPLWMILVWVVHAIVVMLEWCFTIDLLDSAAAGGLGRALREMETTITFPWLALVLAIASVFALYEGIVRRRVADTIGRTMLMATMIAGGMWVIADPAGTIGALARWASQASLGALAVASRGTPHDGAGALASSMGVIFTATVEDPWCYMEFGDVAWCRDPARLDPRLRAAGQRIAGEELHSSGCPRPRSAVGQCLMRSGSRRAIARSVQLLEAARTNGALFLALPANGPARNSINESGSLLRALCQSPEATNCRGPTAAQAEFRTNGGTWARVGGLLLIVAGVVGMLLLVGFIAMRLLLASVFSLLYLLLAPGVVLAPALGESGRAVFRRWLGHLLGAVVGKLLFSFLLGVVLAVLAIISSLRGLGWWTQWLLMSMFWWGAFLRRDQAIRAAEGTLGRELDRPPRSLARRMREAAAYPRVGVAAVRTTKNRVDRRRAKAHSQVSATPGASTGRQASRRTGDRRPARQSSVRSTGVRADGQVARMIQLEQRDARELLRRTASERPRSASTNAQLARVREARASAVAAGEERRAHRLQHRAHRIERQIEVEQRALKSAREVAGSGARALPIPIPLNRRMERDRERLLETQAALPRAADARRRSERRDYPALAGLAGLGRAEYERLPAGRQRSARVEIDRQLAWRSEVRAAGTAIRPERTFAANSPTRQGAEGDSGAGRRPREAAGARTGPASRPAVAQGRGPRRDSAVLRDAREVAAGRKRQLGIDRS